MRKCEAAVRQQLSAGWTVLACWGGLPRAPACSAATWRGGQGKQWRERETDVWNFPHYVRTNSNLSELDLSLAVSHMNWSRCGFQTQQKSFLRDRKVCLHNWGVFTHLSWKVKLAWPETSSPERQACLAAKPNNSGTRKVDSTKLDNNVRIFEHISNVVIFLVMWRCCWTFFWTASAFWKHHLLFHLLSHYLCRLGKKCRLSEINYRVLGFGRVKFLIGVLAQRDKVIHHAAMIWLHSPEQSHLMICPLSNWFLQLLLCRR